MYHWEGAGGLTQLEFELFHWHGDPEMRVFTAAPVTPTVSVDGPIPVGATELTVSCSADGALVAVTEDGTLLGRADGRAAAWPASTLDPAAAVPTTLDVVVTGHNLMPWEGTCEVIVPGRTVAGLPLARHRRQRRQRRRRAQRRRDGRSRPSRSRTSALRPAPASPRPSRTASAVCTVTDPTASFPDAGVGELVQTLPDHFALVLDPGAAHGDTVPFELDWTADGGWSGSTAFAITVCDPLVLSDVSVGAPSHQGTVVTWTTNMPATSVVRYGTASPPARSRRTSR